MNSLATIMTPNPAFIAPNDNLQRAAQLMEELDVGVLPICDGERLVGILTDRDIAIRAVAHGKPAERTPASEAMSSDVEWAYEDEPLESVRDKMESLQVRRIPVVDRDQKLIGIVSLGDLAVRDGNAEQTLTEISEPARPAAH